MRYRVVAAIAVLTAACSIAVASAQQPAVLTPGAEATPIRDMDTLVVSGVQPGPGLWQVRKGDHVMWVLGTLSPLPKGIEWESRDVEAVIAQAQEVIDPPGVAVDIEGNFFQRLALLPKALGARKNPDGATLQQIVPTDTYARWLALKRKYIGSDRGIEEWRPMFAAMELYGEAIEDKGLRLGGVVKPVLDRAIKQHKVTRTSTMLQIKIADPKVALKEFRASRLDDLDCFGKTMQHLETDLDAMRERGNAWAIGDIETLRALPFGDQYEACLRAGAGAGPLRKRAGDIEAQIAQGWLEAAERALASNTVTFATLPMRELLKPDGYLATLQSRGYEVVAP